MMKKDMIYNNNITLSSLFEYYSHVPEFGLDDIKDINHLSFMGNSMIHVASAKGMLEHIKALVFFGANLNIRGDLDNTPLHDAAMCGQDAAVLCLLELGANPNLVNEFAQTPLDCAELGHKWNVVDILKKKTKKNSKK